MPEGMGIEGEACTHELISGELFPPLVQADRRLALLKHPPQLDVPFVGSLDTPNHWRHVGVERYENA